MKFSHWGIFLAIAQQEQKKKKKRQISLVIKASVKVSTIVGIAGRETPNFSLKF